MKLVVEALALLTPFDIDIPKRRIGPNADGGYVLADSISPVQPVVSYGISTEYRFEEVMAQAGHKVYMFDHTIDGINRTHPNMMWHREGVAGTSDPANSVYSIADHLARYSIQSDRLILKMDVEGAEFTSLSMINDDVLLQFEQIVLEVHHLSLLANDKFRTAAVRMFRKLNRLFTLFHVHANNVDGPNGLHIVAGIPISNLLELSYIRTNVVRREPSRTLYPTVFDYPNVNKKDKLLWFFPFIPTHLTAADFALCEDRIGLLAVKPRIEQNVSDLPRPGRNIAMNRPASQSSLSPFSVADDAQGAVNGNITGSFGFHTAEEVCPWWQVDLLESLPLQELVIFNRLDACAKRAYRLIVSLGDETGEFWQVHDQAGRSFGGADGRPARIDLVGQTARFVRIELPTGGHLHLDEVEVYAASPQRSDRNQRV